jgi:hypothetical protein
MNRILILAAMLSFPFAAHAAKPIGIESRGMQVKAVAQSEGYMKRGSGQRLTYQNLSPRKVKVFITAKGSGALPGLKQTGRHDVADATFSIRHEPDGEIFKGKKQAGRVFQPLLQME